MSVPETTRNTAATPHIHETGPDTDETTCPYCGGPVTRKQYRQIVARIEAKARGRVAEAEEAIKQRFARDLSQAVTKAKKDAAANREAAINERLRIQREALDRIKTKAVSDEKARAYQERLQLEQKLEQLTRQLQRKGSNAHEIGEPSEVNLYERCRAEFSGDRISRIAKGVKGPDIIIEVIHNNEVIGKIVLDSKNHRRWSNRFVEKLRNDQLTLGADFAILSTSTFPKGAKHLHLQNNIIIADPARIPVVTHLLRRQIVQNHLLKLGSEARNDKASRLLDFVTSPVCTDLLDQIAKLTEELLGLDLKETQVHAATWKKRGELIRAVRNQRDQIAEEFSRITMGAEESI
jgi:hypothetical protein